MMLEELRSKLEGACKDFMELCVLSHGELNVTVLPERLLEFMLILRDRFNFEQLIDASGVDYSAYGCAEWATCDATATGFSRGRDEVLESRMDESQARFGVSYHLLSLKHNLRLRVKVPVSESNVVVPSLTSVWSVADWYEREIFDLFGLIFEGHEDLRRILTDYGFVGHPFRKDFPVSGHVEMRYDEGKGRVVYGPVEIDPRVNVPRVVRDDNRYAGEEA